jgi:acyl-CoA dehydrogenase
VLYENVRVPLDNLILGWGRGFEIIQGRLGPGRLHHWCVFPPFSFPLFLPSFPDIDVTSSSTNSMRSLGLASRALDLTLLRATDTRKATFGKSLFEHGTVVRDLAESRIEIDQARLLVLAAAVMVDEHPERAKGALWEIGMAKVRLRRFRFFLSLLVVFEELLMMIPYLFCT